MSNGLTKGLKNYVHLQCAQVYSNPNVQRLRDNNERFGVLLYKFSYFCDAAIAFIENEPRDHEKFNVGYKDKFEKTGNVVLLGAKAELRSYPKIYGLFFEVCGQIKEVLAFGASKVIDECQQNLQDLGSLPLDLTNEKVRANFDAINNFASTEAAKIRSQQQL